MGISSTRNYLGTQSNGTWHAEPHARISETQARALTDRDTGTVGSFGLILMHVQWLGKYSKVLAMFPTLFVITILFGDRLETALGNPEHGDFIFFTACILYVTVFLFIACTTHFSQIIQRQILQQQR